jgi:hypothetical protein
MATQLDTSQEGLNSVKLDSYNISEASLFLLAPDNKFWIILIRLHGSVRVHSVAILKVKLQGVGVYPCM